MINEEELLAMRLYDIYCEEVGGVAYNGDPLPTSKEFFADMSKSKQVNAWKAVALDAYLMGASIYKEE
jgi:hypothetical protein